MKNLLFPAFSLLLLASCSKETTVINTYPPVVPFRVSGINDLVLNRDPFQNSSTPSYNYFFIQVYNGNGSVRHVQLSVNAIPGIGTKFSVTGGTPDFYSSLSFTDSLTAPVGTYPMQVTATPDSGAARLFKFNLQIAGDTFCAPYFNGKEYRSYRQCNGGAQDMYEGARLERIEPDKDTLLLSHFRSDGLALKLVINCQKQTLSIPQQRVGSNTYIGTGTLALTYNSMFPVTAVPTFTLIERTASGSTYCDYSLVPTE